jgi:nicotinamidase-related amidase
MADCPYSADRTALLVVDPYNDFMSEGGKFYEATREVAEAVGFYANMRRLLPAIRAAEILVVVVPHHRWRGDDIEARPYMTPWQARVNKVRAFADGSWGGAFHDEFGPKPGDVVAYEHRAQSGFTDTDLDAQLRRREIAKLIVVGMVANASVEGTARAAVELGYHLTLVRDATAAFDHRAMLAAHEVNGPLYAHSIQTTAALVALLP